MIVVPGGGMQGIVSAGMCAALEALGLTTHVDGVFASSSGAINASYTVTGQARDRARLYLLAARRGVVDPRRMLRWRPPFRLSTLFDELMVDHPHAMPLPERPELRIVTTRAADGQKVVLGSFRTPDELRRATWASAAIPALSEGAVELSGEAYADGGLRDPLSLATALGAGATHVLVLRSRSADYRMPPLEGARFAFAEHALRTATPAVRQLALGRPARYNAQAAALQFPDPIGLGGRLAQLAPPSSVKLAGTLEYREHVLLASLIIGARVVYRALCEGR